MIKIAVLITVYNRIHKTLQCLDSLFKQIDFFDKLRISIYLVDDGSTDGTTETIYEKFPQINIMQGTGNLYWNGGMRQAFEFALKKEYDYFLWLNNDTILFPRALTRLLDVSTQLGDQIIVIASFQDPESCELTYGGVTRLDRLRPLKFTPIEPIDKPIEVETMNGNCVLIPQNVARKVGNLDSAFTHAMGDFDYGLRARKLGFKNYLAPGYHGYCMRNPNIEKDMKLRTWWENLVSPFGLPPKEWAVFAKRYAGPLWPIYWISPYFRRLCRRI